MKYYLSSNTEKIPTSEEKLNKMLEENSLCQLEDILDQECLIQELKSKNTHLLN